MDADSKSGTASHPAPLRPRQLQAGISVRSTPMLLVAACFAIGIGMMHWRWLTPTSLLELLLGSTALAFIAMYRAPRVMVLPLCVMWCGLGWLAAELEPPNNSQAALLRDADGLSRRFTGSIERITPAVSDSESHAFLLDVQLQSIEDLSGDVAKMAPISGGVRMIVHDDSDHAMQWQCGEEISTTAILHAPDKFMNAGAWDFAAYLAQNGIGAHATVTAAAITHSAPSRGAHVACWIHTAQVWAASQLERYVDSQANRSLPRTMQLHAEDAGAFAAMLFGDRTRLDRMLKSNFVSTGSFHLFVVSGLHIALIAAIVYFLLRKMRISEKWSLILMIAVAAFYALLTGFGEPVQRALVMTTIFAMARLLWRTTPPLNALGITALILLMVSPHQLFDASFQMTALAVLAISGIAMPLGESTFLPYARAIRHLQLQEIDATLEPRLAQFRLTLRILQTHFATAFGQRWRNVPATLLRVVLWTAELALVSIIVEVAMTLPMAVWFHRVPLLALPANLVALPLLLVLAPLGMLSFLAASISPWLALLPMSLAAAILHIAEWFAATLAHLHAANYYFSAIRTPAPDANAAIAAVSFLAIAILLAGRKTVRSLSASILCLACFVVCSLWTGPMQYTPGKLEVSVIDVGQGDSILAISPDGRSLLVDAGGPIGLPFHHARNDESSAFDIGEEVVSPYLWSRNIHRLDVVAITHPHSDHMGGMPAVLRNFRPRELWLGSSLDAGEERTLLATAADLHIPVRHYYIGDRLQLGVLPIRVLWPPRETQIGPRLANNDSLVLELDNGASRALLEGDAEAPSEAGMLASGLLEPVTLLKVAHHGSKTSTTPEFLHAIAPSVAIISVGRENPFGHPKQEVLDTLTTNNVRYFRTDRVGQVTVLMDSAGHATANAYVAQSR